MLNLYDRLIVVTCTGILYIFDYKDKSKEKIQACKMSVNLEIQPLVETVTCACLSFDNQSLALATQVLTEGEKNSCNRVRFFKVVTGSQYKLVGQWDGLEQPLELHKVFRHIQIELTLNKCALVIATKYGVNNNKVDAIGKPVKVNDLVSLIQMDGKLQLYSQKENALNRKFLLLTFKLHLFYIFFLHFQTK